MAESVAPEFVRFVDDERRAQRLTIFAKPTGPAAPLPRNRRVNP